MSARIRFEVDGATALFARVFFVADDGTETDISTVCTALDFHADGNGVNTAKLSVVRVEGMARAELADLVIERVKVRRWWHRFRPREVTSIASRVRERVA